MNPILQALAEQVEKLNKMNDTSGDYRQGVFFGIFNTVEKMAKAIGYKLKEKPSKGYYLDKEEE